jgi:nitroreductase
MRQDDIKEILRAATQAPSGENAQPWRFEVSGTNIDVFNRPEQDQSLYNWNQYASYMANGAVIENLIIAAQHFNYNPQITFLPDSNKEHLATIQLIQGDSSKPAEDLYPYIEKRVTNRKPYKTEALSSGEIQELVEAGKSSDVSVYFTTDPSHKEILGQVGSTNERVMLSNKSLHQFFFSHINWNKTEDDKKKVGFFIETLELPPPAKIMFRLFKNWKVMKLFNKISLNEVVGKQNGAVNAQAGAFGILVVPRLEQKYFIETGRVLERIWLTATKMGLSMQPLTGVLFFMLQIRGGNTRDFSQKQIDLITSAYGDILKIFNLKEQDSVVFMFRVGRGDKPTAQSSRFQPEEVIVYR